MNDLTKDEEEELKKDVEPPESLSDDDVEHVEELKEPRPTVIYEIVREHGVNEMRRPNSALWWSGVAAGIALSLSVFAKGFFEAQLGDVKWSGLISNLGYTVGFLIVIMGRMQLFTENTITLVLPLLSRFSREHLSLTARVWGMVFVANMVGCFAAAALAVFVGLSTPEHMEAALDISRKFAKNTAWENLRYGIPAGFIMAALVWVCAAADSSRFWLILVMTYVIALGGFTHVVAGSTELFMLVLNGELSVLKAVGTGIIPTLVGNVLGGTGLFAVITYAQVKDEV